MFVCLFMLSLKHFAYFFFMLKFFSTYFLFFLSYRRDRKNIFRLGKKEKRAKRKRRMYSVNRNCTNVCKLFQQNVSAYGSKASKNNNELYAFKFNRDSNSAAFYSTKTSHKPIRKLMVANRGMWPKKNYNIFICKLKSF